MRITFIYKTEIYKLKEKDNICWYNFYFGSISQDFTKDEQSEICIKGTVYDFSVAHNSVKKEDILNIHQYLAIRNNMR